VKLNIGSGEFPMDGWVNIDLFPPADIVGDVREMEFEGARAVNMDHSLEHFSYHEVAHLLRTIHSWCVSGADIRIEVPDMGEIMRRGDTDPLGMIYTYGAQSREGEFHLCGFTDASLKGLLEACGFKDVQTRVFLSEHRYRPGMPCLEAIAHA
jgi:hypothetical protein